MLGAQALKQVAVRGLVLMSGAATLANHVFTHARRKDKAHPSERIMLAIGRTDQNK